MTVIVLVKQVVVKDSRLVIVHKKNCRGKVQQVWLHKIQWQMNGLSVQIFVGASVTNVIIRPQRYIVGGLLPRLRQDYFLCST